MKSIGQRIVDSLRSSYSVVGLLVDESMVEIVDEDAVLVKVLL